MIQGPYHVISTGLILTLAYLFSLLVVRMQLVTSRNHRRFWNTLLLLFFLSTALLGLLLAVKVNYKLNISWVDAALQWHVDLGIGLAFVSVFHLSWHLGYFKKILSKERGSLPTQIRAHLDFSKRDTINLYVLLGLVSIIAQLVLLREFMKTLHGNELIIGIYLAIWMMLSSAGAWSGSRYRAKISRSSILKLFIFLGGFPLLLYILLVFINRIIFLPGYDPGMLSSICYITILLAPFTLVSGFLFSYISRSVKNDTEKTAFYLLDSMGSLLGGILFGLILVFFLDNLQVLAFLFLITGVSLVLILKFPENKLQKTTLVLTGVILSGALMLPAIANTIESMRFRDEIVLETRDTPYGNLTFTEQNGQVTAYMNRFPVSGSYDIVNSEESVHFPALQHTDPDSFLLIGGGFSGKASEIAKYKPLVFDYCEADPWVYRMGREHLDSIGLKDLNFINMDGRNWLQHEEAASYDVIISAIGDPHTIGWNRYYTKEFFQLVHKCLSPGGIFGMQLSTGGNYINDEGSRVLGINYQTLKYVFENVVILSGNTTYFLASDGPVSLDIPGLLADKSITTTYVHPDYMELTRLQFDSDLLVERISREKSGINTDLQPMLFFKSISSWNSRFGGNTLDYTIFAGILVFLVLFFSYSPLKTGMYVSGFTAAGMQVLLILVIQSFYGFAYLVTPLMITVFMAGIVAGTWGWKYIWREPSITKYTGLIWIMAISAATAVIILKTDQLFHGRLLGQIILGVLNLIPGMITGSVYGMSLSMNKTGKRSGIGGFYSADLAGAALGSFIPAVFILPLIGVVNTFILFCGINVVAGLYILTRWRHS